MTAGTHANWSRPAAAPSLTCPSVPSEVTAQPIETEHGQAVFRLRMAVLIAGLVVAVLAWRQPDALARVLPPLTCFVAYAYLWVRLARHPGSPRARQWLSLVLDHLLVGWGLWQGGVGQGLLIWVPLVVSIGHGLRFGAGRGLAAAAMGGGTMWVVTQHSPHWAQTADLRVGLAMAAVIAPLYAARLAQRIERARVNAHQLAQSYAHQALHDPLTGLLNRNGLEQAFRACANPQGRSQHEMGLLYLDLDGFKRINDEMGHEAGDEVLRMAARHLRAALRATDPICRLGGDEFVVLLPLAADRQTLELVAHKLNQAVHDARLACDLALPLSVSTGACLVQADVPLAQAVRRADQLMYAAKRRGKNQHQFGVCAPHGATTCQQAA